MDNDLKIINPIKVKAYGLINFTKKQYTITQTIVFVFLVVLFLLSFLYDFNAFIFGNARILILGVAFLESIETFFMFKKFREKEINKNK